MIPGSTENTIPNLGLVPSAPCSSVTASTSILYFGGYTAIADISGIQRASTVSAPEIDSSSTISALTLPAGGIVVLRSRYTKNPLADLSRRLQDY